MHIEEVPYWLGIALCLAQAGLLSGLNLAIFSVSRLRLEVEAANQNRSAIRVLSLRKDSNLTLATVLWGNVAMNVLLTLLSGSVLAGLTAFLFSTFVITLFGEILPQAYFARNALQIAGFFTPLVRLYRVILFPIAKPTAMLLNYWLGPEGIALLRERDFRALIMKHVESAGTEIGRLEAVGALNFLDLDDIAVRDEGEPVDPRSVITLPMENGRPVLPKFRCASDDAFLRRLDASGKKWVIFVDSTSQPILVLDAHHFLRDALFNEIAPGPEAYWHRPIVVSDVDTRIGNVMSRMKVKPEHPEDDVIDNDLILIWGKQRRVITGADLLGRLLRGIVTREEKRMVAS